MYYLHLFDGKKKTFEEVEHVFNAVYHEDCVITDGEGNVKTRDEMKKTHAMKLALASKCTLLLFRVITFDTIEIKYRLVNEEEDRVIHQLITTDKDNRIMKAKVMIEDWVDDVDKDVIISEKLLGTKLPQKRQEGDKKPEEEEQQDEGNTKRRKLGADSN